MGTDEILPILSERITIIRKKLKIHGGKGEGMLLESGLQGTK